MTPVNTRLFNYIEAKRNLPFKWGEHDCYTFTNGAFHEMYGKGYADHWEGLYATPEGRPEGLRHLRSMFPYKSLDEALGTLLKPVRGNLRLGDLVAIKTSTATVWHIKAAMGICVGTKAVFVGDDKLIFKSIDDVDYAWRIKA